ncbi:MAG: hypothetical protein Q4F13_00840 [Pseudomonadota bacterium]|nr:hypothetical protein [Pseudomonadota bacterium]
MCGYCTEAGSILPYLHRQRTQPGPVPLPHFINPLQEALDMPATLAQLKARHQRSAPSTFSATLPTAFCRLWQTLFSGSHAFTLAHIQAHYAPADIQHFLGTLAAHPHPAFAWLGSLPPHASPQAWQAAIAQAPQLPAQAEATLHTYAHTWLQTASRTAATENPESTQRHAEEPAHAASYEQLEHDFPHLWFSALYLLHHQPRHPLLKTIALQEPAQPPDFTALDLWLQRQTFSTLVRQHGLPWLAQNTPSLRTSLVQHSVLSGALAAKNVDALYDTLTEQPDDMCSQEALWLLQQHGASTAEEGP